MLNNIFIHVTLTTLIYLKIYKTGCDKLNEHHGEAFQLYGTRHAWTSREVH